MKRIAILGSTGSIGRNALAIAAANRDRFRVTVLTAGSNVALLEKQMEAFAPEVVAVADGKVGAELKRRIGKRLAPRCEILSGADGIARAAAYEGSDFVLSAIVGAAGLIPTLSAVRSGKTIGLANKESLVMAGKIVMDESRMHHATIIPVDSEHSAIFQCIKGHRRSALRRIILTASGGPFADRHPSEMETISPEEALNHPKWKMGRKITIDSATLMNKGFEVIEAHHLFGISHRNIDVLIHPQSIIHSIVEFKDRSCLAQLSVPDMKGPISYALSYPHRIVDVMEGLSLHEIGNLTFKKPSETTFPCLSFAYDALAAGGTMPAVLNAANEVAVDAFLKGVVRFTEIPLIIRETMQDHSVDTDMEIQTILEADRWARKTAEKVMKTLS